MRESIGATWIFSICITFIVLFTSYLAVSINYAKAFKVKSHVITMIENNEGIRNDQKKIEGEITGYLLGQNYSAIGNCNTEDGWTLISTGGSTNNSKAPYCIYQKVVNNSNSTTNVISGTTKTYYKVKLFFNIDIPIIGVYLKVPVSGVTKTVYVPTK